MVGLRIGLQTGRNNTTLWHKMEEDEFEKNLSKFKENLKNQYLIEGIANGKTLEELKKQRVVKIGFFPYNMNNAETAQNNGERNEG
jgi:hypothetical protein